ncbi:MAG: GtrA family protein [Clostridia bacterium]|nr:GtrA family protein [Clostridia bacterium]
MLEILKKQYFKYKEIINYLIFGVLTTIVNFITYFVLVRILNSNETISNALAWIISVIFAYITNKIFVFNSKDKEMKIIIKELISFIGCRAFSGILDIGMFYILVNLYKINDIITKIIISILVVVLNYIFSKLLIFKKREGENKEK